ncbi:MAG TPA: type II toxin-antitoxin system Phd/YefM family antitoxin [Gemmatimonadales bacterium]|nr:type II toxin-antitoxin system Phd/YefM family antitoxin [Gemmatimonadales bacterium]
MKEYTYSEARQRFAAILERARREGAVRIRRKDGTVFVLQPEAARGSPLDVPAVNLQLTRDEVVDFVREGRRPA